MQAESRFISAWTEGAFLTKEDAQAITDRCNARDREHRHAVWECVDPAELERLRTPAIDVAHLARQREWSEATFGPGARTAGVCDHIRKELREIEADPGDLKEWVDVVILALDGAWRTGATPEQIIAAIKSKQAKNETRQWPDWRTAAPDKAIEHVRI